MSPFHDFCCFAVLLTAKLSKITPKIGVLGLPNFGAKGPQISDGILQIWVIIEQVSKFGDAHTRQAIL